MVLLERHNLVMNHFVLVNIPKGSYFSWFRPQQTCISIFTTEIYQGHTHVWVKPSPVSLFHGPGGAHLCIYIHAFSRNVYVNQLKQHSIYTFLSVPAFSGNQSPAPATAYITAKQTHTIYIIFTFIYLADALIHSNLQMRNNTNNLS